MVLGNEILRPHRQLGIPPTTILFGLLHLAHKSTAGFLREESHTGPKRLVAVVSLAGSSFSQILSFWQRWGSMGSRGVHPCEHGHTGEGVRRRSGGSVPNASWSLFPSSAAAFHCSSRKSAFSLLADSY